MCKVGYPKFGLSDFYHSQVVFKSEFFDISIHMSRRQLFPLFTYSNARLMLCLHVNEDKILMLLLIGLMTQVESHLRKIVWNILNQKNKIKFQCDQSQNVKKTFLRKYKRQNHRGIL